MTAEIQHTNNEEQSKQLATAISEHLPEKLIRMFPSFFCL